MRKKYLPLILGICGALLFLLLAFSGSQWYRIYRHAHQPSKPDPAGESVLTFLSDTTRNDSLLADQYQDFFQPGFSPDSFLSPPDQFRPWTRWWWPGNRVNPKLLSKQLRQLDSIGFGGVEIQALSAGLNPSAGENENTEIYSVDSEDYYAKLRHVFQQANKLGMEVDLHVGSGWPGGGPHIQVEDNLQSLYFSETQVLGGKKVRVPLPVVATPPAFYMLGMAETYLLEEKLDLSDFRENDLELLVLIAAKVNAGKRTLNPFDLEDQILLDRDSLFVITDKVNDKGEINWEAPKGYWRLIAIHSGPAGGRPILSATPSPGLVVNPLDSARIWAHNNYLFGLRTGMVYYHGNGLRGIVNDNFTYKAERLFNEDFFEAFEARRGYQIQPYLPVLAVPAGDNFYLDLLRFERKAAFSFGDWDERIRYDYTLTISELLEERFLATTKSWADEKGLLHKAQPFGLPIDIIAASGQVHIPEVEQQFAGGSKLFLKLVSAGAQLSGKNIVSAEAFGFKDLSYSMAPQKWKIAADKLFLNGVNHLVYHGTPYPIQQQLYGQNGWFPYSSPFSPEYGSATNFGLNNVYSDHLMAFNQYVQRAQYLLRQGKPTVDVLLYYPFLGFPLSFSESKTHNEILFNGLLPGETMPPPPFYRGNRSIPHEAWYLEIAALIEEMESQGISWSWINDRSLQQIQWQEEEWKIGGQSFSHLILPNAPHIQLATAKRLDSLYDQGARLLIYGTPPTQQPGFKSFESQDEAIQTFMNNISLPVQAQKPEEMANLLLQFDWNKAFQYVQRYDFLRHQSRQIDEGTHITLFVNQAAEGRFFRIKLSEAEGFHYWLDAGNGQIMQATPSENEEVLNYLPAYGSIFLYSTSQTRPEFAFADSLMSTIVPTQKALVQAHKVIGHPLTDWSLLVRQEDQPSLYIEDSVFFDWKTHPDLRYNPNDGFYRTQFFIKDTLPNIRYVLDLGQLYHTADVHLNTELIEKISYAPFTCELTHKVQPGWNSLEIWITPTQRNAFMKKSLEGDPAYQQFSYQEDQLQSAGLLGPVRLWEILP